MKMPKPLTLFVLGSGLILATADAVFAQSDILHVPLGSTTPLLSVNASQAGPPGQFYPPDGNPGSTSLTAAKGHQTGDGYTATLNTASATLAGTLILLFLQRRRRMNMVLRPGA